VRPLWIFRLIFYPAAIGLIVLLVAGRGGADEPAGGWLLGSTAQDRSFELRVVGGRPVYFDTYLAGRCSDGQDWHLHWYRPENAGVLTVRPPRFSASEAYSTNADEQGRYSSVWLRMEGRLVDGKATGRLSMRIVHVESYRRSVECTSGWVAFSAA
jgi:hypothetical protein